MNAVYLSGVVVGDPMYALPQNGIAHMIFQLAVRHRTIKGEAKSERYCVNLWRGLAEWGNINLRRGQSLCLVGYLTQHQLGASGVAAVEVTAEQLFFGQTSPLSGSAPKEVTTASAGMAADTCLRARTPEALKTPEETEVPEATETLEIEVPETPDIM